MSVVVSLAVAVAGGCALPALAGASPQAGSLRHSAWEERVGREPCDWEAHRQLVEAYQRAGRYGDAFREAAWLAWFAPREYAKSAQGLRYLRDRRARDRAANAGLARPEGKGVEVVVAAVDVRRGLADCCFNGAIAQQAGRLRGEVEEVVRKFASAVHYRGNQGGGGDASSRDPVGRMGLACIYLTLDDILALQSGSDSLRARTQALRAAATQAAAAAAAAPGAPGPHRTLAMIRARLADVEDDAELWELAIAEGKEAYRLDPREATLAEMLWALTLRAGHWEEARQWEAVVTRSASSPRHGSGQAGQAGATQQQARQTAGGQAAAR